MKPGHCPDPLLGAVLGFAPMWEAIAQAGYPPRLALYLLFSGGPDSVGLALALQAFARLTSEHLGMEVGRFLSASLSKDALGSARKFFSCPREVVLTLLHLNHRLRSSADDEAAWVREFAQERGLAFSCENVRVSAYAARNKMSVEEAGRDLRYAMLQRHLDDDPASLGFTAHTLNDNAESVLYSLASRSGIAGMLGIAPALHGRILRPFIGLSKEAILKELRRRHQDYLTDETNLVPDRPRTFLRHKVVPRLMELNPRFLENALATCDNLRSYDGLLRWALNAATRIALAEVHLWRRRLPLPLCPRVQWHAFAPASWGEEVAASMQVVFHHVLRCFGATLGWDECARLAEQVRAAGSCRMSAGRGVSVEFHSPSGLLFVVKGRQRPGWEMVEGERQLGSVILNLRRASAPELRSAVDGLKAHELKVVFAPAPGAVNVLTGSPVEYLAAFDARVPLPLTIRSCRRGDRLQLAGGGGRAKVSDVFTNAKVPRSLRPFWPAVADATGEILWLPGLARSGAHLVTGKRGSGLVLSWKVPA